jgi:hypothetical protein
MAIHINRQGNQHANDYLCQFCYASREKALKALKAAYLIHRNDKKVALTFADYFGVDACRILSVVMRESK